MGRDETVNRFRRLLKSEDPGWVLMRIYAALVLGVAFVTVLLGAGCSSTKDRDWPYKEWAQHEQNTETRIAG